MKVFTLVDYETLGIVSEGGKLQCWLCPNDCRGRKRDPWPVDPLNVVVRCPYITHMENVEHFLRTTYHNNDQRHRAIQWFESRINKLACEIGKQEVRSLFFVYTLAPDYQVLGPFQAAVDRLEFWMQKDRVVALMLAAWKKLAQARASEQLIGIEMKDLRMAQELCDQHRNDWKTCLDEVLEGGQICLVAKLVRPFVPGLASNK
jgi:hypothetical protein